MRRRRIKHVHGFGEVNVTPLIDVVMCLIIFYLMVGKLATDRKTPVTLPPSDVGEDAARRTLIVNVAYAAAGNTQRAAIVVDGESIADAGSLERLVRSKVEENAEIAVQIRAEQDFPFGVVGPIMRACTAGGAKTVWLAATPEGGGAP